MMEEEEQPSGSQHRSAERFGFGFFFSLSFFAGGGAGWPDFSDGRRRFFSAMSSRWLLHLVTASTTFYFTMSCVFCSFFLMQKSSNPARQMKIFSRFFCICFDTSIWERAHWKMFPLEKLTACPVVHCVTVCSVQLDVAASFCNQSRIHMTPRTSEKRFRREFLKSGFDWYSRRCRILAKP